MTLRLASCFALLLVVLAGESSAAEAEFAACPGAAEWFAAEEARHEGLQLAAESEPADPALRDELLRMEKSDQEARSAFSNGGAARSGSIAQLQQVDSRNLERLKQIVAGQSFPRASQVGRRGVAAAWLLVQHADSDPDFQERMLDEILLLTEQDGIDLQKTALLTDRILVARGKPQRYGSQFLGGMGEPLVMRPVEAPRQLDQRRRAMHLMPAATYKCMLEEMGKAKQ